MVQDSKLINVTIIKMKYFRTGRQIQISFLFLLLISIGPIYGQDNSKLIETIREEFQSINTDSTLRRISLSAGEFLDHSPDGGADLIGFFKKDKIRKIVRTIGVSTGNEIIELYFSKGQLIFVYEEFNSFITNEETQSLDLEKTERSFEARYYFSNKKLFQTSSTGKSRFIEGDIEPQKNLLDMAEEYQTVLENRMHLLKQK